MTKLLNSFWNDHKLFLHIPCGWMLSNIKKEKKILVYSRGTFALMFSLCQNYKLQILTSYELKRFLVFYTYFTYYGAMKLLVKPYKFTLYFQIHLRLI